jgi:uncharacterized membrane protein YkgB
MLGREPYTARLYEAAPTHRFVDGGISLTSWAPKGRSAAPKVSSSATNRRSKTQAAIYEIDRKSVAFCQSAYPCVARGALFVVFFWFGLIKLLGLSPATGLAQALTVKTVGLAHFGVLFNTLAVLECVIGVLCLIPRAARLVVALLVFHMAVVCAPLVLVPELTWQAVLVPTMDGQYIIKNVLIIAAAVGLAAHAAPRRSPADSEPLDVRLGDSAAGVVVSADQVVALFTGVGASDEPFAAEAS